VKGALYGTTSGGGNSYGGTVFSIDPGTGAETVVYSFCSRQNCSDGKSPKAGLIDVKGTLYGTTSFGGSEDAGAVFSLDPGTGVETVLHSFCSRRNCADGDEPVASLLDVKGKLYGTTSVGGTGCCGTVFAIDRNSGKERVLHSFADSPDGEEPVAGLIDVDGVLYGTTEFGGSSGVGTVFSVDLGTGAETVLYSFAGAPDGAYPVAGLIDVNGMLYGTTKEGGSTGYPYDLGTIFSIDPSTDSEAVLYSFCSQENCTDGASPEAGLIDVGGLLYGTTYAGRTSRPRFSGGTVFSFAPATGTETVLHAFCSGPRICPGDGLFPEAGVIDVHGALYDTTIEGGDYPEDGTVFSLKEKR